jgi:hypothetical protein
MQNMKVLHIYRFSSPKGARSPLDIFCESVTPIKLSTCMRIIFVFNETQLLGTTALDDLLTYLQNPPPYQSKFVHQLLECVDAYAFLLYWTTGGLHPTLTFNDPRLLGQIRCIIESYARLTQGKRKQSYDINKDVLNSLLVDMKQIHLLLLSHKDRERDELSKLFDTVCKHCAWARYERILAFLHKFDYADFCNPIDLIPKIILKLSERIESLEGRSISNEGRESPRFFDRGIITTIQEIKDNLLALKTIDNSDSKDSFDSDSQHGIAGTLTHPI